MVTVTWSIILQVLYICLNYSKCINNFKNRGGWRLKEKCKTHLSLICLHEIKTEQISPTSDWPVTHLIISCEDDPVKLARLWNGQADRGSGTGGKSSRSSERFKPDMLTWCYRWNGSENQFNQLWCYQGTDNALNKLLTSVHVKQGFALDLN